MLILPLAPDLRVGYKPVVTFVVVFLCVGVHLLHERSNARIRDAAELFCSELPEPWLGSESGEIVSAELDDCASTLEAIHIVDGRRSILEDRLSAEGALAHELDLLLEHYDAFAAKAPSSFQAATIYYPDAPNPLRMLTSSVLHADWGHLVFNMIFFLAFATALEILIGNARLYIGIMITIAVASAISYSLYTALVDYPSPSLGFSDVVMGMIGLAAYLMPRARIRTLVWLGFWAWILFIPAWIFAVWYVGSDLYELITEGHAGGTNLLAHVVGAVTGYYLGRRWLSERKWLIEVELRDEIEHMRAARGDWLGITGFAVDSRALKRLEAEEQWRDHEREFDTVLRRVYRLNETHQSGDAILVLLEGLSHYGESADELRYVHETVKKWTPSRFTMCFERHYVNFLVDNGKPKEALNVCADCFAVTPDFVLARPLDVMPLARLAAKQERHSLAYSLARDAEQRYGDALDTIEARLLEARTLAFHLDRPGDASRILEEMLGDASSGRKAEVDALAARVAPLVQG